MRHCWIHPTEAHAKRQGEKENDGRAPRHDLCRSQIWGAILGNKGLGKSGEGLKGKKAPGMLAWRRECFQKGKAKCRGHGNAVLARETPQIAQDQHLSIDGRNVEMEKQNSCLLASRLDVFSRTNRFSLLWLTWLWKTASAASISERAPQPGVCGLSVLALTFARHLNLCMWG